jgi:hypothetical protein
VKTIRGLAVEESAAVDKVEVVPISPATRKASAVQPPAPMLSGDQIGFTSGADAEPVVGKATIVSARTPATSDQAQQAPTQTDSPIQEIPISPRTRKASGVQPEAPVLSENQVGFLANASVAPVVGKATVARVAPKITEINAPAPDPEQRVTYSSEVERLSISPRSRRATDIQPPAPSLGDNEIGLFAHEGADPQVGKAPVLITKNESRAFAVTLDSGAITHDGVRLSEIIYYLYARIAKGSGDALLALDELQGDIALIKRLVSEGDRKFTERAEQGLDDLRAEILGRISEVSGAIPQIRPSTTVSAVSNPALQIDTQSQSLLLNLKEPGSYDHSLSKADARSIQDALDELFLLRTPSGAEGNRITLDENGRVYSPDLSLTRHPVASGQISYARGVLNAPPRVLAHLRKRFDTSQAATFNEEWEVVFDTLLTVANRSGEIVAPDSGYYHVWSSVTAKNGALVLAVNGKVVARSSSALPVEWRGILSGGDVLTARLDDPLDLSEIELGMELLVKQTRIGS